MATRAKRERKLQKIYDQVPEIECKGLCHDQCTAIPVEPVEQDIIMSKDKFQHGENCNVACTDRNLPLNPQGNRCGYLDPLKGCAVYANRPLICRLYGTSEGLICEHGCKPKGGKRLRREYAYKLLGKVRKI